MGKLVKSFYLFCFLIIVYIAFGFEVLPIILKNQIIKTLDEKLTQKTTIEKIEFNPLTLKIVIHDFKLSDSNDVTTLSFKEFLVDFSALRSIKQRNIRFKDIALKDAFVNIILLFCGKFFFFFLDICLLFEKFFQNCCSIMYTLCFSLLN